MKPGPSREHPRWFSPHRPALLPRKNCYQGSSSQEIDRSTRPVSVSDVPHATAAASLTSARLLLALPTPRGQTPFRAQSLLTKLTACRASSCPSMFPSHFSVCQSREPSPMAPNLFLTSIALPPLLLNRCLFCRPEMRPPDASSWSSSYQQPPTSNQHQPSNQSSLSIPLCPARDTFIHPLLLQILHTH